MANVTGPTNRLPGQSHSAPKGVMCDEHPDRVAVKRVTGEVDSFGSEEHDMCQECFDVFSNAQETKTTPGNCDHCNHSVDHLTPMRDLDEGLCGPVYYLCNGCAIKLRDYNSQE